MRVNDLGIIDYNEAYLIQKKCVSEVLEGQEGYLLICEHPTILTLGRLSVEENVLLEKDELGRKNVKIVRIDRGGEVTLHSPGQLVVYPIINLNNYKKDLKFYMNKLEQVAIDFLKEFDILTCRILNRTGVWFKDKKIVSVGIGVRQWISYHGFAININTDLDLFSMIKPCGLNVEMISMQDIKQREIDMCYAKEVLVKVFCSHFSLS